MAGLEVQAGKLLKTNEERLNGKQFSLVLIAGDSANETKGHPQPQVK
jgi:hypothetical protein